jgi:hypothetical protein
MKAFNHILIVSIDEDEDGISRALLFFKAFSAKAISVNIFSVFSSAAIRL